MDPFAPPDHEVSVDRPDWAAAAAESLRTNGFCALRGAAVSTELCAQCGSAARARLDALLPRARARGLDARRDAFMFRELCKRMHHLRFDVRLPAPWESDAERSKEEALPGPSRLPEEEAAAWAALHREAHRKAWPVLQDLFGAAGAPGSPGGDSDCWANVDIAGCVISLPGSGEQKYHQDGSREGFFNVFVPLVDITPEIGPTEFQPGSHLPAPSGQLALAAPPRMSVAPCLSVGDVLIFDYRVRHRGLANSSSSIVRPIAYLVYTRPGVSDIFNFPTDSLFRDAEATSDAGRTPEDVEEEEEEAPEAEVEAEAEAQSEDKKSDADGAVTESTDVEADATCHARTDPTSPHNTSPDAAHPTCNFDHDRSWWNRLQFRNAAQERLGVDGSADDVEYREIRGASFAAARPVPLLEPSLVCLSRSALASLGAIAEEEVWAEQLCGNMLPEAAAPASHCYCGYQYGTFSGQLGDGAALTLGEVASTSGEVVELNLKGTGVNPLTRWWYAGLNGRKHVRAMVREFLMAEALHALGVPTTRGVAVVAGRDSADATPRPCAVLLRAAETFLRFGSFEVTLPHGGGHHAPSAFDWKLLREMADHCICMCYKHVADVPDDDDEEDEDLRAAPRYCEFLLEVTRRTARLAAAWQCLGAAHGMLNTDNLSIAGLSLDHGLFAFCDHFDPSFGGEAKQPGGRYCLRRQAEAARWACERLAEALMPLHCTRIAEMLGEVSQAFDVEFNAAYGEGMRRKLGLKSPAPGLVDDLLSLMEHTAADWTCTFRALTEARSEDEALARASRWSKVGAEADWKPWLRRYTELLEGESSTWGSAERIEIMEGTNPIVIPREWILERAAKAAELGEYAEVSRALGLLTKPFKVPQDPADACPPSLSKLDPGMAGQLGSRAVAALEDPGFWRSLCPELRVASAGAAAACREAAFKVTKERVELLRGAMRRDGVFTLDPRDWLWSLDLSALARGIERLHAAGWPPAFIWVYDEAWIMMAQVVPLLREVLGADVSFDLMAFRAPPGEACLPVRRERTVEGLKGAGAEAGFRADGMPTFAACWVPLVDAPPTGACLMCVPRSQDAGYLDGAKLHWGVDMLHHVRALSLEAGGACVLSHRLFHWGRAGDTIRPDGREAPPLAALSLAVAADAFETPRLPRRLLPLPPLQLRVALAAGQALTRTEVQDSYGEEVARLLWDCFLVGSGHFDSAYASTVFKASPLGRAP